MLGTHIKDHFIIKNIFRGVVRGSDAAGGRRSFPGTGWGPAAQDPAVVVRFDPEPTPAETLRLRYEERWALARLGVLPPGRDLPDRLREREALDEGFARPPRRD